MTFALWVLAGFGGVAGPRVLGVPLEMDRQAVVSQHLAGQDQVLGLLSDALDAAGSGLAPYRHEGELLLADAQVLLVRLPPLAGAHLPHSVQVFWVEEGLCGSAAASFTLDVVLPVLPVQRGGGSGGQVALQEGFVALVRASALAGGLVPDEGVGTQQQAQGKSEEQARGRHSPPALQGRRESGGPEPQPGSLSPKSS